MKPATNAPTQEQRPTPRLMEHSPLPWSRRSNSDMGMWDAEGKRALFFITDNHQKDLANARLIVTAVNTHDSFAKVLRMAASAVKDGECASCYTDGHEANPNCEDHEPFDMPSDDAVETLHSLIESAREALKFAHQD